MKKLLILIISITYIYANSISIALSANVSYAMSELIKEYNKKYPTDRVNTTLGSSGKLASQILRGARYDIYMSADMSYPTRLYQEGYATTKPKVYAKGALVMISTKNINLKSDLSNLKDTNIKKIAIANPNTAPYGVATMEAISSVDFYDTIKSKFVYGEGISQTVQYTMSATDVGLVSKSALYSSKLSYLKESKNWIDVDHSLYTPISQGVVILTNAKDNPTAKRFYKFLFSDEARSVLKAYGYILP
jgi:molybdate transport system substrate-binding protein